MTTGLPSDPRGLIAEAYRMELTESECRSILLDWLLGLPTTVTAADLAALVSHYGAAHPDHPMTAVLREGLDRPPPPPGRRRRR